MIVVTFALPQESGVFRKTLRAQRGRLGAHEVRVVHLGVGLAAAADGMQRVLAGERPKALICAGFGGGLDPRVRVGDLVVADNFSSPELRARAQGLAGEKPHRFFGQLVTRELPAETAEAKAALARETGALAVDMETAVVAAACGAASVPLLSVRVISDAASTPLPVPFEAWFDLRAQSPRRWGLMKYLLQHPQAIGAFANFLRGLPPAHRALADFLVRFLSQPS